MKPGLSVFLSLSCCYVDLKSCIGSPNTPASRRRPARPPAPFTWAGETLNGPEQHRFGLLSSPAPLIMRPMLSETFSHSHKHNKVKSNTLWLHRGRNSVLRVESWAIYFCVSVKMCEVRSGHAALFSTWGSDGARLMNYFVSMWEATRIATQRTASQDTLIHIDSRRKEANEKLIKRKYVLTRGASGVLLYTQSPVRYL